MQLALHSYVAAAGVAVIGAGLIQVTPTAASHIEQRAVALASAETLSDLVGPLDAVFNGLGGLSGDLTSVLPSLNDLSSTFADTASGLSGLELFDPAFWQEFWQALIHPTGEGALLMLIGAFEQLPVIGPLLEGFGLFVVFPVSLLLAYGWSLILDLFGVDSLAAAAVDLGTGLQGVSDAALAGAIDPAMPAGVSTALGDITLIFGDAAGVLDPTSLVQDVTTALDPSAVASVLDVNPIADIATVIDPSAVADIATAVDPSAIADIATVIDPSAIADVATVVSTSLMP